MQKTKLGITVGLMGATLYFLGLISFFSLIVVAGYILLFESNEWLKHTAVKAVGVVIVFSLLSVIIGISNNIFDVINGFVKWFNTSFRFSYPFGLEIILRNAIYALEKITLFILGLKALNQGSIKVCVVDKVINKNK